MEMISSDSWAPADWSASRFADKTLGRSISNQRVPGGTASLQGLVSMPLPRMTTWRGGLEGPRVLREPRRRAESHPFDVTAAEVSADMICLSNHQVRWAT